MKTAKSFKQDKQNLRVAGVPYLKQQVILKDSLDWLQQIGAQRQRAFEGGLPIPEELGQSFTPHAIGECSHWAGGQRRLLAHQAHTIRVIHSKLQQLTWDSWCSTVCIFQSSRSEETKSTQEFSVCLLSSFGQLFSLTFSTKHWAMATGSFSHMSKECSSSLQEKKKIHGEEGGS